MSDQICTKCKETKPATPEFFYRNSAYKSGLRSHCKDCVIKYRKNNREKISEANKKYRKSNLEKIKQSKKEYREANPEKIKELKKKWAQANPEKDREGRRRNERKRRALKLQNGYSPYTEAEVLNLYGTNCHLCGQPIDFEAPRRFNKPGWELGLQMDHVIPISKGGPDTLENVKPAHGLCNITKNNKV